MKNTQLMKVLQTFLWLFVAILAIFFSIFSNHKETTITEETDAIEKEKKYLDIEIDENADMPNKESKEETK